jgi:hypothetical protein
VANQHPGRRLIDPGIKSTDRSAIAGNIYADGGVKLNSSPIKRPRNFQIPVESSYDAAKQEPRHRLDRANIALGGGI